MKMEEIRAEFVDYDPAGDSLLVGTFSRVYSHSVMVGRDLILDFGRSAEEELGFVGFEILDASEKFGIKKHLLKNIRKLHAEIEIGDNYVKLSISIVITQREKERERSKILEIPTTGLPPMTASITI